MSSSSSTPFHVGCVLTGSAICYCDVGQGVGEATEWATQSAAFVEALFQHVNSQDGSEIGCLLSAAERYGWEEEKARAESRYARLVMAAEDSRMGYASDGDVTKRILGLEKSPDDNDTGMLVEVNPSRLALLDPGKREQAELRRPNISNNLERTGEVESAAEKRGKGEGQ
mmetsp:Transcript_2987/g.5724  ORF Transcript_2987/g.5724 Transcript_2987/m.5724 type:complete len:170 (-) Transcript_2987:1310-1819(-)